MKNTLFISIFEGVIYSATICAVTSTTFACSAHAEESKKISHALKVDFAYYPQSDYQKGGDHFAKITGPFDGILAKATWKSTYTIPTPLGEGELLSGANVELNGSLEFSPLSIRPIAKVSFTPLPFLVFDVGSSIGSGWNALGFEGFCKYNGSTYKNLTLFAHYYHDHWVGATFQFDTGEIFEGDWTHVVMVANYQMIYKGITGLEKGQLWAWQTTEGYANGLGYEFIALLGYQMPKVVNFVGIMADMYGNYSKKDFGDYADTFGKFMTVKLNFLARLALNKTNSLTIDAIIASRRSFTTDHKKGEEEPHLIQSGREWYFDSIAFSWERSF
ncbi:hypothetical protein [Fibrobacter sp. UWB12]|uniref:hypothetical protein n=1 Tax=Fibrobacter sp. UWB12 TaxID=1896203 RepID=UPI00091C87C6|nr:hypothetical protein [Fibrobacter sp. UWB12]SHK53405.1 hypothetical protein SAMN05720759_103304 [Fibrobacter sp. UWB12]